jgi:hypothetical protein
MCVRLWLCGANCVTTEAVPRFQAGKSIDRRPATAHRTSPARAVEVRGIYSLGTDVFEHRLVFVRGCPDFTALGCVRLPRGDP